jgi:hypothetical protein
MGDLFNAILAPIEWLVAWIMYGFHQALTAIGMPPASGWTWALSIVGLVVVMRAAMIPLFVKQIMASRKMQMIQPELQKIQKKYKGKSDPESRQALTPSARASPSWSSRRSSSASSGCSTGWTRSPPGRRTPSGRSRSRSRSSSSRPPSLAPSCPTRS